MSNSLVSQALQEAQWLHEHTDIHFFGEPALLQDCEAVTGAELNDGTAQEWATSLQNNLAKVRDQFGYGRGLAANQIGILKQMALVWLEDEPEFFINLKGVV